MSAIRRLVENRSPESAAQALARYLGAKGEPIGRDFMRFAGQRQGYYAYSHDCGYGSYGYNTYGYRSVGGGLFRSFARFAELRAMGLRPVDRRLRLVRRAADRHRADQAGAGFHPPVPVRPPGDTTVFPKSHYPRGIARRPRTPEGVFPLPNRAAVASSPAPGPAADPRRYDHRAARTSRGAARDSRAVPPATRGHRDAGERRRRPLTAHLPSRTEPVPTGMRPVYRPEPRVTRAIRAGSRPERAREPAPAPVVHERPVATTRTSTVLATAAGGDTFEAGAGADSDAALIASQ